MYYDSQKINDGVNVDATFPFPTVTKRCTTSKSSYAKTDLLIQNILQPQLIVEVYGRCRPSIRPEPSDGRNR